MANLTAKSISAKLIVGDEEAMTTFYCAVFGLKPIWRVQGDSAGTEEPFREVILARGDDMASGTLVMFNYVNRPKPSDQQVTLVFLVEDIDATADAVVANGGSLVAPMKSQPEHGVKVLFARDPEGAIMEIVELLPR